MDLVEWTSVFIDSLDMFRKEILNKSIGKDQIECEHKTKGKVLYLIKEDLDEVIIKKAAVGQVVLVCLNNKDNISTVVKNWQSLIANKQLKIIFSNPHTNSQWSLMPYVHNMVSDPKSLKTGLVSLSESVPYA